MKIKLNRSQWEGIGKKAGWKKTAAPSAPNNQFDQLRGKVQNLVSALPQQNSQGQQNSHQQNPLGLADRGNGTYGGFEGAKNEINSLSINIKAANDRIVNLNNMLQNGSLQKQPNLINHVGKSVDELISLLQVCKKYVAVIAPFQYAQIALPPAGSKQ